jgi:hypothetical protein
MTDIQLSPALATIQARATLVKTIRSTLHEAFGAELPSLRGNIALVTEILICIESMRHKIQSDEDKDKLFREVYGAVFGEVSPIESTMLSEIVSHLRSTGAVYRRTKIGNLIRAILRIFRA